MTTLDHSLKEHFELARKNADIARAAEKLVKCKGRYHAEQNYKALAALFGVDVPADDGWISVDDEMPTHDEEVIVYANGFVHGGYTYSKYSGHFLDASYDSLHDVTHWMPLPEGPKK